MLTFTPDKRGQILEAALDVFGTYGFRKTSMDDIARAAGMSRPALYQEFKNKTDIFRALGLHFLDRAIEVANKELQSDATFETRFLNALELSILTIHRLLEEAPHGQELMGVSDEVAADIDELWKEKLTETFAKGFQTAIDRGEYDGRGFEAAEIARLFMYAMDGLKHEFGCNKKVEDDMRMLVRFFVNSPVQAEALIAAQ